MIQYHDMIPYSSLSSLIIVPVQLGLRVAMSCGAVARLRAVVRRDVGPRRWSECFTALYRVGDVCRVAALLES
jgi:hypothetical protein